GKPAHGRHGFFKGGVLRASGRALLWTGVLVGLVACGGPQPPEPGDAAAADGAPASKLDISLPSVTVSGDESAQVVEAWTPPEVPIDDDTERAALRRQAEAALRRGDLYEDAEAAAPIYLALVRSDGDDRLARDGLRRTTAAVLAAADRALDAAAIDPQSGALAPAVGPPVREHGGRRADRPGPGAQRWRRPPGPRRPAPYHRGGAGRGRPRTGRGRDRPAVRRPGPGRGPGRGGARAGDRRCQGARAAGAGGTGAAGRGPGPCRPRGPARRSAGWQRSAGLVPGGAGAVAGPPRRAPGPGGGRERPDRPRPVRRRRGGVRCRRALAGPGRQR